MGDRGKGRSRGFTLIELIVVLALVAGLSIVAFAAFIPGYTRAGSAYARDDFERQLLELPQRVRASGRGGILTSRSGDNLPDDAPIAVSGVAEATRAIEDWRVLRLSLPAGMHMRVAAPILYHFSGSCEGGEVVLEQPPTAWRYELTAPLCRPVRRDADPS